MNIQLRGTIRAALQTPALELDVPAEGVALSDLLASLASEHPRARRYLSPCGGAAVLRVVHNGAAVPAGGDPVVLPHDELLLMHAVAGGSAGGGAAPAAST